MRPLYSGILDSVATTVLQYILPLSMAEDFKPIILSMCTLITILHIAINGKAMPALVLKVNH